MIGLVQKFKIERNAQPYPEHEGEYFVLFPKKDRHAHAALMFYAKNVAMENIDLSNQLIEWLQKPTNPTAF